MVAAGFAALAAAAGAVLWYVDHLDASAVAMARSSDPRKRMRAAERLAGRTGDPAVRTLRRLAGDRDKWVARQAVRALAEAPGRRGLEVLTEIVKDRKLPGDARGEAAANLGRLRGADPAVLTAALAGDADAAARAGAAKGLMRMRDPATMPQLVDALADGDARVRTWAITAIHRMIVRRFGYDARKPPRTQRLQIERIRQYLRRCGAL